MSTEQPRFSARTKARKRALDALFVADFGGSPADVALEEGDAVNPLTSRIISAYVENADAVDDRIASALTGGWTLERMPRVDRCLARIAVTEMDLLSVAPGIAISEALELAGWLSTNESPSFLNGLLGRVAGSQD